MAKENIEFLGQVSDDQLKELYSKARALIFSAGGGLWPSPRLKQWASGCPVIAFAKGGALETIVDPQDRVILP